MNRKPKRVEKTEKRDWEEVDLDHLGEDEMATSATDDANSYQNHMLIYDEDVDNMLEEMDEEESGDEDEGLDTPSGGSTPGIPVLGAGYRGPVSPYNIPAPPSGYRTPPGHHRIVQRMMNEESDTESDTLDPDDHGDMRKMMKRKQRLSRNESICSDDETKHKDTVLANSDEDVREAEPTRPSPPLDPFPSDGPPPMSTYNRSRLQEPESIATTPIRHEQRIMQAVRPPPGQPLPRLLGARTPMSQPGPIPQLARSLHKSDKVTKIKSLLQQGKKGTDEVFDILIRSVKLNVENATMRILKALEQCNENLCDEKYREKESTASLLHVALLYQRKELCKKLIEKYPGLLRIKYTSEDYKNQTCFHIAAANDDRGLIVWSMLNALANEEEARRELLNTIADGRYFVEERPEAATCLAAAAWTGQVHMIRTLVDAGADLGLRSIGGNTLLHYIIYLSTTTLSLQKSKSFLQEVYNCSNNWWQRHCSITKASKGQEELKFDAFCHLLSIRNESGLIPAALAVNIHSPLTPFILGFEPVYKLPQVKFGAVAWATYDITDILSYKPGQGQGYGNCRYDCSSVLHVLAHTERVLAKSEDGMKQSDIAEIEPINSAIKMKWSVYRYIYILWFLVHTAYMTTLTTVVLSLHKRNSNDKLTVPQTNLTTTPPSSGTTRPMVDDKNMTAIYGLFLIIPITYLIFELIDFIVSMLSYGLLDIVQIGSKKRHGKLMTYFINHCTITGNAPYRLLAFCFSICMFTWYGMYMSENKNCDIPLSLALILGWIFMLNFTRACRHVCRFSIMIQKMFFRDFLYFITVYMFILIAFSSALHLVLPPGPSVGKTVMGLLNIVTNAGDSDDTKPIQEHYAAAVLSMYAILAVILLLNMLIAMMNTSYEAVKSSKTNLWRYQQLSILLMLERRFIWWEWLCLKSQSETKMYTLPKSGGGQHHRIFLDVTEEKLKS